MKTKVQCTKWSNGSTIQNAVNLIAQPPVSCCIFVERSFLCFETREFRSKLFVTFSLSTVGIRISPFLLETLVRKQNRFDMRARVFCVRKFVCLTGQSSILSPFVKSSPASGAVLRKRNNLISVANSASAEKWVAAMSASSSFTIATVSFKITKKKKKKKKRLMLWRRFRSQPHLLEQHQSIHYHIPMMPKEKNNNNKRR